MGVVTLDPPERSIGDHLGAGGVVGTEVDVAGRYEAWASRIVPLWATTASAKAREPAPSGLLLGRYRSSAKPVSSL
jgi:hypothetical protein